MAMNVYDFDGTIYAGDSSIDFFFFCARRHPLAALKLPRFIATSFRYKAKLASKTEVKEAFFSFLQAVPDVESEVACFWDEHWGRVQGWYLKGMRADDVVVSASPEFLLSEACSRLGGLRLIASEVDPLRGSFYSKNCRGEEKVSRFRAEFPDETIENFYSDSVAADGPMAMLAERSWLVRKGTVFPWPRNSV